MADEKTELQRLKSIDECLRSIRAIMVWFCFLSILGVLVSFFYSMSTH
jgi:hypothetical protein